MMGLLDWLIGPLGALLGGLIALAGAWIAGRRSGLHKAEREADRRTIETIKEYEDAKERSHAGGGAWIDRVRADGD